jgi:crotonobetainyl-CoA:carnitine CoA-transferase CaiB-like acyl-CoA transferase
MGAKLPLEGMKVADFSWFGAGPICAENLGRYGATVVRVESEAHVDGLRSVQPFATGKTGYNVSGYFNNYNAGKMGVTFNLSTELGLEMGRKLVKWCDIFVTNQTSRILEQWGYTYEELVTINPTIIAAYQPMQGSGGPHKDFFGFGAVLNAITGYNNLSGFPHRPPMGLGTNYPDYVINPGHTLIAILAAVRHRKKTGKGQRIELAQIESSVAPLAPAIMEYTENGRVITRGGNRLAYASPHGAFRCADNTWQDQPEDRWVAFGVFIDAQWRALVEAMGSPAWAGDAKFATLESRKRHEDELEAHITAWTRERPAEDVMTLLQSKGVPAGVVQNSRDVLTADEHLKARQYYQYLDHPETGRAAYDGAPFRLSKTPGTLRTPATCLGEYNEYVCKELLGMTDDEIAEALVEQALF